MKTILPDRSMRRGSSPRALRWIGGIALTLAAALLGLAAVAGFFDRDPIRLFGNFGGGRVPVVALFFSGDMGLRFGMGPRVTKGLAARGIPVVGVNSPTRISRLSGSTSSLTPSRGCFQCAGAVTVTCSRW